MKYLDIQRSSPAFNLPLENNQPSVWWDQTNTQSDTGFLTNNYTSNGNVFYYVDSLNVGDISLSLSLYKPRVLMISPVNCLIIFELSLLPVSGSEQYKNRL